MNGCWNLSITFSVPMEICLSPLVNMMNYIDLIVYQFYRDKLCPLLYIVSIEWALHTLNLFSSSIYSKLISVHPDWTLGECMGQVRGGPCLPRGEWAERPQIWAPVVSGFYLLLKLEFMKYCAQTSKAGESSWLSLRGTQFIFLFQSVTSKTQFHCKIFRHNGGLAPLGQGLERVMTQSSSEKHLTHLSPPHASAGDLAAMGRGPCRDLGLRRRLWGQTPQHRPERGQGYSLARSLLNICILVSGNSFDWGIKLSWTDREVAGGGQLCFWSLLFHLFLLYQVLS